MTIPYPPAGLASRPDLGVPHMTADDNQMMADQLVADYLRRLREAARALPADRREELIEEITAHIAEARAEGAAAGGDPLAVRNILDRLGDPAEIVRTAADHAFDGSPAPGARPAAARRRPGPLEITAVVLLLVGGIVLPVAGWVAGVILLWISPRWTSRDKWIGTLVWPGGLLAPALLLLIGGAALTFTAGETTCSGSGPAAAATASIHQAVQDTCVSTGTTTSLPVWLSISLALILLAVAIAGPIYTAVRLLHRVQDAPVQPVTEPADLQPV